MTEENKKQQQPNEPKIQVKPPAPAVPRRLSEQRPNTGRFSKSSETTNPIKDVTIGKKKTP
jgi:hypothetical protein